MDPNACLERWRNAEGSHEMKDARQDLASWLNNGGFWPEGMSPVELGALWRLYRLRPPEGYRGFSAHDD